VLPHVNWGDLFWDLSVQMLVIFQLCLACIAHRLSLVPHLCFNRFYVSAAFNLGSALMESLNGIGILYFSACYLAVITIWFAKVSYDARYSPDDNLFHRGLEVLNILVLATIIQHIRPVATMSDTRHDSTTAVFCVSLMVEALLGVYRYYDVYRNGLGGPEAKHNAFVDMRHRGVSALLYAAAAVWAIVDYAMGGDKDVDAEEKEKDDIYVNRGPIIMCLMAFFTHTLYLTFDRLVWIDPGKSHKEKYVPMNLEFVTHRFGEWTMLMLGESVLALLIVEQSHNLTRYYTTFYAGIITVTLFQYLYFRSQPEVDDHAMRRAISGGKSCEYHTVN
jgi:Bacterial low temperature requirement A protein (LtrA)